jgi:hypothetical protein
VPKLSLTTLAAIVLFGALAYLAFNPEVAQDVINWLRRLVRGAPNPSNFGTPNYQPIVPGR